VTDKEFLQWIHDRLQYVHNTNGNLDYMRRLRALTATTPEISDPCYNCESIIHPFDWMYCPYCGAMIGEN